MKKITLIIALVLAMLVSCSCANLPASGGNSDVDIAGDEVKNDGANNEANEKLPDTTELGNSADGNGADNEDSNTAEQSNTNKDLSINEEVFYGRGETLDELIAKHGKIVAATTPKGGMYYMLENGIYYGWPLDNIAFPDGKYVSDYRDSNFNYIISDDFPLPCEGCKCVDVFTEAGVLFSGMNGYLTAEDVAEIDGVENCKYSEGEGDIPMCVRFEYKDMTVDGKTYKTLFVIQVLEPDRIEKDSLAYVHLTEIE